MKSIVQMIIFPIQDSPVTISPNKDGTINIPIDVDGTSVVINFKPVDPNEPISVSPIETTACAELGINSVTIF